VLPGVEESKMIRRIKKWTKWWGKEKGGRSTAGCWLFQVNALGV
jgi:hypothetical protein